jgi:hypothetical protein
VSAEQCIGEPVSWLRLERLAAGASDAAASSHIAACPACGRCLAELGVAIALPALPVIAPRRRARWPALAMAVAAAAVAIVVLVPRREARTARVEAVATVKGAGEVVLGLVRERAGVVRDDVATFAPGDRWKVVVTCAPEAPSLWIVVGVRDGATVDYPLAPARIGCGNRVVVPGAFVVTGARANQICVRITAGPVPATEADDDDACLSVTPE